MTDDNPLDYLKGEFPDSIYLFPTDIPEITRLIRCLKETTPGYDDIPAKVVKGCLEVIAEPLEHLVNLSLSSGYFPVIKNR